MKNASSLTILLVYIDDVILFGSDLNEFNSTKLALDNTFKIKHFGSLNHFLSIEVAQSKERIFLNQRTYCPDLLEDSGFIKSNQSLLHLILPSSCIKTLENSIMTYLLIRKLVGRLLYLNATRPDINFITQQLSQLLSAPIVTHFNVACRVLKYFKTCPTRGIRFPRDSALQLNGYSNDDWEGCIDTRRSVPCQYFFLVRSLISWRTNKQLTFSRSSSKSDIKPLQQLPLNSNSSYMS